MTHIMRVCRISAAQLFLRISAVSILLIGLAACATSGAVLPSAGPNPAKLSWLTHCESAGVKIYAGRPRPNGIRVLKIRSGGVNFGDQYKLDDPYGSDFAGEAYLLKLLHNPEWRKLIDGVNPRFERGFTYVEAADPVDGKLYRYRATVKQTGVMDINAPNVKALLRDNPKADINLYAAHLVRSETSGRDTLYGVTFDDISSQQDRTNWIAGSSLRVIELATDLVVAERIGFMIDLQQGSTARGRAPWLFAAFNACPAFPNPHDQAGQTLDFLEQIFAK